MILEIKDIAKSGQIRYTKIESYIYDNPYMVEVGVMANSIKEPLTIGKSYQLTHRNGLVEDLTYIGVNPHPITTGQSTTQLQFVMDWWYRIMFKMYRREDTLFSVSFENYIPYTSQIKYFMLQLRLNGLFATKNDLKHTTEYKGIESKYLQQPTKIKGVDVKVPFNRYATIEGEVSEKGDSFPLLIIRREPNKIDISSIDNYIEPKLELEYHSIEDINLGDCIVFKGAKYVLMEMNTFYSKEKSVRVLWLGS